MPPNKTLEKAKLIAYRNEVPDIEFMFNPTELSFEGVVETSDNPGVRSQQSGKPKVSFSNIQAYRVTINNILFDTYEDNKHVVKEHIELFKQSVKFVGDKERPPIYTFSWGQESYLKYCFIERLSYKLTMFTSDGVPVRAVIDNLTLKEVDEPPLNDSSSPSHQKDRQTDTLAARQNNR